MAISSYVSELKQKHANLSDQLERSQRIPSIDSLELKILKLKKLKINNVLGISAVSGAVSYTHLTLPTKRIV